MDGPLRRPAYITIGGTSTKCPSFRNNQGITGELRSLRNAFQHPYAMLHHAIGNVRTKHQAKVQPNVHLAEPTEQFLVTIDHPVH